MNGSERYRRLPSVDSLMTREATERLVALHGRQRVVGWVRRAVDRLRSQIDQFDDSDRERLTTAAADILETLAQEESLERLCPVINATGVVLHTNLGRAPLAERARQAATEAAQQCNLELDLASGQRRYRGYQIASLWRELTGAEDALVVNNCAAATLLALQALAGGSEVVVSRGQLVEIGGSYRLPEVFRISGAILREVGTTNRTHLSDYENAIGPNTAALLRVHESNYRILGFTESVGIETMAELAHRHGVLAIDDIGSGCLFDLRRYGLPPEPTIGASLAAGADLVLFSGDKLFGGPQCGVLLGTAAVVERVRKSPLARAVRIDKLCLAALQATLEIHLAGRSFQEIPVLRQLTTPAEELRHRAENLCRRIGDELGDPSACGWTIQYQPAVSAVGGGSIPTAELPTSVVAVRSSRCKPDALAQRLRTAIPRVLGRIENDAVLLDMRTVPPDEDAMLAAALVAVVRWTA
jgi:L-seryl-tRNA(Ser) seleniumtransferase